MGTSASVQSQVTTSEGKCLFYLVPLLSEFEAEFPRWLPDLAHLVELKEAPSASSKLRRSQEQLAHQHTSRGAKATGDTGFYQER